MFTSQNTVGFTATDLRLMNEALEMLIAEGLDESNASDVINNNWQESGNTVASLTARPALTLHLYKFTAYNSQAMYGWGNDAEADAYCDHLNRNRDINVYGWSRVTDDDEINVRNAHRSGVNLADELIHIEAQGQE